MPTDTYEWTEVKPEDCVYPGSRLVGYYSCRLGPGPEDIVLYRKPGKRPMYFATVSHPIYYRSKDRPTIEGAISNLNQKRSAHKGGE